MLTTDQLEFLANEMGVIVESVQNMLINDMRTLRKLCSDITVEEYDFQEENYEEYDPDRLSMAENILDLLDEAMGRYDDLING